MSFEIARSGINAVSGSLEAISNNIANSGTYGFKSSRANFSAMYSGTQMNGAELSSMSQSIEKSGGLFNTGRGMDAMIQGRGFFAVKDDSGQQVFTRVGIFNVDKDGFVVDANGRKAQGYGVVVDATGKPVPGAGLGALGDLKVPTGQIGAQASDKLSYSGNLSADWGTKTIAAFDKENPSTFNSSSTAVAYDSLGVKHKTTQYFVKTGANTVDVVYSREGNIVAPNSVSVDSTGWTVVTTSPPPAGPGLTVTADPVVPGSPATWTVTYAGAAPVATSTATLSFSTTGQLERINGVPIKPRPYPTPADWKMEVPRVNVAMGTPASADPITLSTDYTGLTQYAGDATERVNEANGNAAGTLTGTAISEDGSIVASYSNGKKQTVGTLALATFANENALQAVNDTSWEANDATGAALFSRPGSATASKLTVAAIEQSNVDMTGELVNLMSAQRNYQANTKVISAENEMMQNLMQAV